MIKIFKNVENNLTVLESVTSGCWIHVVDPTPAEITQLQELGLPHDYITYPLDLDERARTEREDNDLLILLRVPIYEGENVDIPYITVPLGIIFTDQVIVTICKRESAVTQEFVSGKVRNLQTAKRLRFTLRLLLATATLYLNYLRQITKKVDVLEDQLQKSTRNSEVLELLKYQKSLTLFTTALKSNELMMERLQRSQIFKQYPEDEDLLEDVITENQQAIEMTNITSINLSSMMDAFASIISNNLNGVMKFLASITIVLSVPTIISSFFGMNVNLPIAAEHSLSFMSIIGLTLGLCVLVVLIFWRRDWF